MKIKSWKKKGRSKILSQKYGKIFLVQKFINPLTKISEEYSLFGGNFKSVIIFSITKGGDVLAVRQFRPGGDSVFLELPGGNQRPGESKINSVRRELLEETGFETKKVIFPKIKKMWIDPSIFKSFYIPCLALDCYRIAKPKLDPTELLETKKIPLNKWLSMIRDGKITDCKTLATTFLAQPYL